MWSLFALPVGCALRCQVAFGLKYISLLLCFINNFKFEFLRFLVCCAKAKRKRDVFRVGMIFLNLTGHATVQRFIKEISDNTLSFATLVRSEDLKLFPS